MSRRGHQIVRVVACVAVGAAWLVGVGGTAGAQGTGLSEAQQAHIRTMAQGIIGQMEGLSAGERRRVVSQYVLNEFAAAEGLPGVDTKLLSGADRREAESIIDAVLGGEPSPSPAPSPSNVPGPSPSNGPSPTPTPTPTPSPVVYYYVYPVEPVVYVPVVTYSPSVWVRPVYFLVPR